MTMLRVFVDSSVFFSATYSAKGTARDLFIAAVNKQVGLVVSQTVIGETRRNLTKANPAKLSQFKIFLKLLPLEYAIEPTSEEIAEAAVYTATERCTDNRCCSKE